MQPIYNNASKIHFSHRLLEVLKQPQGVKEGMSYPFQLPFPYFYFDSISNSRCRKGNSGVPVNFEILVLAIVSFRTQGFSVLCLLSSLIFTEVFEDSY